MSGPLLRIAKQTVLHAVRLAGYEVIKTENADSSTTNKLDGSELLKTTGTAPNGAGPGVQAPVVSAAQLEKLQADNEQLRKDYNEATDEIRRLKIRVTEIPEIDYQAMMEQQAKAAAFHDADAPFHVLYERVRPFSMTSIERLYAMYKATEYVVKAGLPGDIVESGVWRGGSMMMAASTLLSLSDTSRRLVLFDTFEGHPKPDVDKDVDFSGNAAYYEWTRHRRTDESSDWARVSLDEVRENLRSTGYPMHKVELVKGMVQDTVKHHAPDTIALLRLDTDWYASTVSELTYMYPRLCDRGVLIIDDYGHLKGQRQAVDEFFAAQKEAVLFNRIDYSSRLIIKSVHR